MKQYPKVIGGSNNPTEFRSIDIDDSGNYVVGGSSYDNSLITSSPTYEKAIVLYYDTNSLIKWAKYLEDPSNFKATIGCVKFNTDGSKIFIGLNYAVYHLIALNTNDGSVINTMKQVTGNYRAYMRPGSIAVDTTNHIYLTIDRSFWELTRLSSTN